jgi:hypothetical protein
MHKQVTGGGGARRSIPTYRYRLQQGIVRIAALLRAP